MVARTALKRVSLLALVLLAPVVASADRRVVPEDVLAEWGYETTHLDAHQTIRRVEPLPDRRERWHPRFDLSTECFESNDAALQKMRAKEAEIESNRAIIYKSAVGMLVRDQCVFFVAAHGTFFLLEVQPYIMDRLAEYLCEGLTCTRSTLLDDL